MNFKPHNVTLYSVGLLGGSLGLALKNSGFDGQINGISSKQNLDTALHLGCIDKGFTYDELAKVLPETDILVLCSPINVIIKTIETLGKMNLPDG
ncbi:MAG: prephenate dehydrogenase/arogenate dehydrogenase family protein, partial [Fibrobacter sp.]|nr:prephenate dehydrogenase/arogenate dehydrogenase family protein [Fibrobacter sp.]